MEAGDRGRRQVEASGCGWRRLVVGGGGRCQESAGVSKYSAKQAAINR